MELNIVSSSDSVSLVDDVFGADFNEGLVHQVLTAYSANSRSVISKQKSRSEVSGGGKKPWKQKGTGRARAGTIRSPIFRGGGITFATSRPNFEKKVNRKMYRKAMTCILSELVREERVKVVADMSVPDKKTKSLVSQLADLDVKDVLIVVETADEGLLLASRNLYRVDICERSAVNPYDLVVHENVIFTKEAITKLGESLS